MRHSYVVGTLVECIGELVQFLSFLTPQKTYSDNQTGMGAELKNFIDFRIKRILTVF